jgi:hypothetical protein
VPTRSGPPFTGVWSSFPALARRVVDQTPVNLRGSIKRR